MNRAALLALAAGLAAGALAVAGCSSSGGSSGASAASSTPVGSVTPPSSSVAPGGSASSSSAGSASSSSTGSAAASAAATSTPVAVSTGTVAPYPTPGRDPSISADQQDVLTSVPGSSSGSCAVVGTHPDLHSGSVAAGNFVVARQEYRSVAGKTEVPEVGLYLIPRHAAHLRSATVTVDPQAKGTTRKVTTRSVQDGDASRYFTVQIPVAAPGTYRLTVVSGRDRGCFVVTFAK